MKTISTVIALLLLSGCASMYPGTLDENHALNDDTAVLLVGVSGSRAVNYLQFCTDPLPCKNYKIKPKPLYNDVIALRIPVPQKRVRFASYTLYGSLAGTTPQGMDYGYLTAKNGPEFDMNKVGVYFYGVLNTDTNSVTSTMNSAFKHRAKAKYEGLLGNLKPVGFQW